jgi:hypothetical protein
MVPAPKDPQRDLPVIIGNAFGTVVVGLVFCTLAWTVGQQVL